MKDRPTAKRCRRICYGLRCERLLGHSGKHTAHTSKQGHVKVRGFETVSWTLKKSAELRGV